ncbi:unnamed protein product, partial [Sphacelaria rigidula]
MANDLEGAFDKKGMTCQRGELLAGTLLCSCGFQYSATCRPVQHPNTFYFSSSARMVIAMLSKITDHKPLFLMGHNCYRYDNRVMMTHLLSGEIEHPGRTKYGDLFMDILSRGTFGHELKCMITVDGVDNVDTLEWYRLSNYNLLKSYTLASIAEHEGIESKMSGVSFSPHMTDAESKHVLSYNIHDCRILLRLWEKRGIGNTILSICREAGAAFPDVAMYKTGAIGASAIVSKERHICGGTTMGCWIPLRVGTLVIFPGPSISSNVVSLNFSSLYPTITQRINISPESIRITG